MFKNASKQILTQNTLNSTVGGFVPLTPTFIPVNPTSYSSTKNKKFSSNAGNIVTVEQRWKETFASLNADVLAMLKDRKSVV